MIVSKSMARYRSNIADRLIDRSDESTDEELLGTSDNVVRDLFYIILFVVVQFDCRLSFLNTVLASIAIIIIYKVRTSQNTLAEKRHNFVGGNFR